MDFFAAHYRQQGENSPSLLLQQYQYRHTQLFFGCMCLGNGKGGRAGGYMSERLLAWFRGLDLRKLLRNREHKMDMLSEMLTGVVGDTDKELLDGGLEEGKVGLAGILCVEDSYLLLRRGRTAICLINTGFGRTCLRRLLEGGEEGALEKGQGSLQPHIGLLFAVESFLSHITEPMIREGLSVSETNTERRAERHLTELAGEAQRRGAENMGAILLRTVPWGGGGR